MRGICPSCERETSLVLINHQEEFDIRDEIIRINVEYYKCEECGVEFEDPKSDYDPLEVAYEKYRELKDFLKPDEIRKFRKKFGLTQYKFSKLIDIGIASINRYENGALQSRAHDRTLKLIMDPRNFKNLLLEDSKVLSIEEKQKIIDILDLEYDYNSYLIDFTEEILDCKTPTIFNGYKKFDFDKFLNCMKFFCYSEYIYKTKLTKLIFYADFEHYRQYTNSITGSCYAHLPYGPVPEKFEILFGLVVNEEETIKIEEIWEYDYPGETYISEKPPDYSMFSNSEIKILTTIKEKFGEYNASQLRDYSHQEKGYEETKDGEFIPYSFAEVLQE